MFFIKITPWVLESKKCGFLQAGTGTTLGAGGFFAGHGPCLETTPCAAQASLLRTVKD
jgi:hypothetical protein